MLLEDEIKELSISYFQRTPVYESLQSVMMQLEKAEEIAYAMATKTEDDGLTSIKIGTTLTLAVIEKIISGKNPRSFSKEDWNDIANKVADTAILMDGQSYTERVFILYANYIDASIVANQEIIPQKHKEEIRTLSEELRNLTEDLRQGVIKEVDYVDRCLWVSFEAMVKLLSSYSTANLSSEFGDLIVYVSDYAVQYARLEMYFKENALLEAYLNQQEVLDNELEEKYNQYLMELEEKTKKFEVLIKDAYAPDFRKRLMNSVNLAREIGAPEGKILDSVAKVDDFFG